MLNIAPALYGQSDKYIQVWIYIFANVGVGSIYATKDICAECNVSSRGLLNILSRGVLIFKSKGINLEVIRPNHTSPKFNLIVHNAMIDVQAKPVVAKKIKADVVVSKGNELAENLIITYLNEQTGKSYRTNNKETLKLINSRLADGFTVEQFKHVIDVKTHKWKNTEYETYLRPQTLFGSKFETYLNETINEQQDNSVSAQRIRNMETFLAEDWSVLPNPKGG